MIPAPGQGEALEVTSDLLTWEGIANARMFDNFCPPDKVIGLRILPSTEVLLYFLPVALVFWENSRHINHLEVRAGLHFALACKRHLLLNHNNVHILRIVTTASVIWNT